MKKIFFYPILFLCLQIYSQNNSEVPYVFDKVNADNLRMKRYAKDTTANALVLFEYGNTIVENINDQLNLKTTVYKKIKIFNKEGEDHATITIAIYNDDDEERQEKVINLKAVTHNLQDKNTYLNASKIYTNKISENWKEVTFTFPNVKPGSILEYQYDLRSKFFFNFRGWTFQSDIPKLQSEFHALIPGNWIYNRSLRGSLKLVKNEATIKRKCLTFSSRKSADCEKLTYIMKDIPAFIEEEEYTTTKENYISKIKFELAEIFYTDGTSRKFTTSWKETDKRLKTDESIGRQIKNKSYFLKNMPEELFAVDDKLSRCKGIYEYIQNYYSLNDNKQNIFDEEDVKKAYKEKFGSVSEINLSLISALRAADIDAKIILLSTRDKGFPTKVHPVMTDFNYIAAYIKLNNETFLLDASEKQLSFKMLPFQTLNSYGRVLDFENESFWYGLEPKIHSFSRTRLEIDLSDDHINGKLKIIDKGYYAWYKRKYLADNSKNKYLQEIENKSKNISIINYNNQNLSKLDALFEENIDIEFEEYTNNGNMIYFNPFISKLETNPFQLNERNYPVDFGYKRKISYMVKVNFPDNYKIVSVPESVNLALPDNGGTFISNTTIKENAVIIFSQYVLNKIIYTPVEYYYIKELFNQIIKTQNSLITLEKT